MRECVRKALITFRKALEDLTVALFTNGEMTGEAATSLIVTTLPRGGKETIKRLKRDIERLAKKKPILVLGWGPDGCADADEIRNFYGNDQSLYCVTAPCADSREVLGAIETWLKDNPDAQILCLGMHGTPSGLQPKEESDGAKITYSELGKTIRRRFCGKLAYLTVFLGACQSEQAGGVWKELSLLPINLLVSFSGKEKIAIIRNALGIFVQQGDLLKPGRLVAEKNISFLVEDIENLQKDFPNIRIFHRLDRVARLTKVSGDRVAELDLQLEQRGRVGARGPLMEAARNAMRSESEKEEAEVVATPTARSKVGTRTIGSLNPKKTRPRERK